MNNMKTGNKKNTDAKRGQKNDEIISFRLKCAKTANGLSHFVMYGDVPKEKTLL